MFGKNYSDAISLVLYYVDDEYRKTHSDLLATMDNRPNIWSKGITIARENGLLYLFSKKLLEDGGKLPSEPLKRIVEHEEKSLVKLRKTLHFVSSCFKDEGLDFIFIKLYRGMPYAPRDVDVLVRREQSQRIFSALKRRNVAVKRFSGVETRFEKEGLLTVDLYQSFYYLSSSFIDEPFLWANQRIVDVCGVRCVVPGFEADFLSLIIHSLLGHRCLSLLDFLYAKNLLRSGCLDFGEMLHETEKYRWTNAFVRVSDVIRDIHEALYSEANSLQPFSFPYVFSTKFVLDAFQGFAGLRVDTKKKFMFMLSAMLDAMYHRYIFAGHVVPFEMPDRVKNFVMKGLYKARKQRGDRKNGQG